jgi:hypothetical protein
MHSRFLAVVLAVAGLHAQFADIPLTGVELRTEHRTMPVDVIAIHNRHHTPLVQWTVRVGSHSIGGSGAIPPLEVHRVTERQQRGSTSGAVVELAVFANGDIQGTQSAITELERDSAAAVEELEFWQTALDTLPRSPQSAAFSYIRGKLNERRPAGNDRSGFRSTIEGFFSSSVPRPISWTFSGVDNLKKDLAHQLTRARSTHAGFSRALNSLSLRGRNYGVTAVGASVESGTADGLAVILTNLRSLPLEAWGYAEFPSGSLRPRSSQITDAGWGSTPPGSGPIAPGEAREIRTQLARPDQPLPSFAPLVAIWQDQIWQGSASERASLIEGRRQQADVHAFWIARLKAASRMVPQAAIASFRAAIEERRRREAGDQGGLMNSNIELFARTAERTPELLHSHLEAFRQVLERQYALLTRSR